MRDYGYISYDDEFDWIADCWALSEVCALLNALLVTKNINWEDAHLTDITARCYNILTNLVLLKIIISHWKLEVVHQASSSIILKV